MGGPSKRRKKRSSIPPAPRRRSARLAGDRTSSGGTIEAGPATSPTDIPRSLVETSPESDRELPFEMELAILPPRRIAAGVKLEAPLVVVFGPSSAEKLAHDLRDLPDLSGVWAYVSLMTEDRRESLAPPQKDLLKGDTTDSIHPLHQYEAKGGQPFAYAMFPDLAITRPGRYCFKVNIIDMNQAYREEASNVNAKMLPALHSHVFDVVDSKRHSGQDAKTSEKINQLRAFGANV